jgi:hypothetical protein
VLAGFWWGDVRARDDFEDLGVDGRITLKWIIKEWNEGVAWIELAQDRGTWQAVVNAVVNLRVS